MRTEREILDLIAHALRQKEIHRQREAERLAAEQESRRVFLQAARAVFTHIVLPEMQRVNEILQTTRMRPSISDTGAFYLPGSADAVLVAKFALPLLRDHIELPLCVVFEAVFPAGMAIYFDDTNGAESRAKRAVEQVALEDVTRELVEDRLIRVLENYLHEL
jgi:hypothetical protein